MWSDKDENSDIFMQVGVVLVIYLGLVNMAVVVCVGNCEFWWVCWLGVIVSWGEQDRWWNHVLEWCAGGGYRWRVGKGKVNSTLGKF